MSHSITINLPDHVFAYLKRVAELARQPVEAIVADSLTQTLPPLLEEIPSEYQGDVYPLLAMDAAALRTEVQRTYPPGAWAEYERLLEKSQNNVLNKKEQKRLTALRRDADILTLRKAYAAVLLKRRGYAVPMPPLPDVLA